MDVKEAVALAKRYIADVFTDEEVENLRLEEIEFDKKSKIWSVTLSFSRPWGGSFGDFAPRRYDYKVVRIADADRNVLSVKNREIA